MKNQRLQITRNNYFKLGKEIFVPLGGLLANIVPTQENKLWPEAFKGHDLEFHPGRSFQHSLDLPDKELVLWLGYLKENGINCLRAFWVMDAAGKVDLDMLGQWEHFMDLSAPYGIYFLPSLLWVGEQYSAGWDYMRVINRQIINRRAANDNMDEQPQYQRRFIKERKVLSNPSQCFFDPEVMACQKDFLNELIPKIMHNPQILAYELTNEQPPGSFAWTNAMVECIRKIDKQTLICISHPGRGLLTADPLAYYQHCHIDFYSNHVYPIGDVSSQDEDYAVAYDATLNYTRISDKPIWVGECAGDEINDNVSVDGPCNSEELESVAHDLIWLGLLNGAAGHFIFMAGDAQIRQYKICAQVLAMLDLEHFVRAVPEIGIAVVYPITDDRFFVTEEGQKRWKIMRKYANYFLGTGVDYDFTLNPENYMVHGHFTEFMPLEPKHKYFSLGSSKGYQMKYMANREYNKVLVYLRNIGEGRTKRIERSYMRGAIGFIRTRQEADLSLKWKLPQPTYQLEIWDLDTQQKQTINVAGVDGYKEKSSRHDYLLAFSAPM